MKAGQLSWGGGQVARSLGVRGSTLATVGAMSSAIALNGMIAVQALGVLGRISVLVVVFASVAACSAAITVDVLERSAKAVSDLRSIGASQWSISSALFWAMFAYGAVGSVVGGVAGASIGSALTSSGFGAGAAEMVVVVLGACVSAVAAGAYAGGRFKWRS